MQRTYQTRWPVCHHCGHQHDGAWEWREDSEYVDCESCGGEFNYSRTIEVYYTTTISADAAAEWDRC